jgi:hypothetical protein
MTDSTHLEAYRASCAAKRPTPLVVGLDRVPALNPTLFPHQRHGAEFALRTGRSALFYDTGLGKTAQMLEWGRCVVEETNRPVLMLAPLAVSAQHMREAERLGVDASISRLGTAPSHPKVVITNYERLERFGSKIQTWERDDDRSRPQRAHDRAEGGAVMGQCQSYRARSLTCRDGFVQRTFCSGDAGCMTCGHVHEKHLPACLRDDIPPHLSKPDGSPLFWPPTPGAGSATEGEER